jgi:predicted nucleotidyltransferase
VEFIKLKNELEENLKKSIDLVSENSIISPMKDYILKDLIKIYG